MKSRKVSHFSGTPVTRDCWGRAQSSGTAESPGYPLSILFPVSTVSQAALATGPLESKVTLVSDLGICLRLGIDGKVDFQLSIFLPQIPNC